MSFAFIILHFNEKSLRDTRECVESIKKLSYDGEYHIVIVENGSRDSSLSTLNELYSQDTLINVIASDDNLGFAKGNNLGCQYAIDQWKPDFLIVINNDTLIKQENFIQKVEEYYTDYSFHILGPDIRERNNLPQNPISHFPVTLEELDEGINGMEERVRIMDFSYLYYWLRFNAKKVFRRKIKRILMRTFLKPYLSKDSGIDTLSTDIHKNIGLHGAALIFSKQYYELYDHVFYPGTFMFKEEDILYYRVKQHNLTSLYHPGIKIHHKEDRSTDSAFNSGFERDKFIIKNQLESFKAYKDYILSDQHKD